MSFFDFYRIANTKMQDFVNTVENTVEDEVDND